MREGLKKLQEVWNAAARSTAVWPLYLTAVVDDLSERSWRTSSKKHDRREREELCRWDLKSERNLWTAAVAWWVTWGCCRCRCVLIRSPPTITTVISPAPRPTSVPSFILIHPTVWPQFHQRHRQADRPPLPLPSPIPPFPFRYHMGAWTVLQTVVPKIQMLRRNGPVVKSVDGVLRPGENLWWEKIAPETEG